MVVGKVSYELHEEVDIGHLIQEILVLEDLGLRLANCLHIRAGTLTVSAHDGIFDHIASFALQVLHLVGDQSPIDQVKQPSLDVELVELVLA